MIKDFSQTSSSVLEHFFSVKIWIYVSFVTPVLHFIEKYLFTDWDFLIYLAILMACDLFTGVWLAIKEGNAVRSVGLRATLNKFIQYGIFLIVIHILIHFRIDGKEITVFRWLDDVAFSFLIVIEAKSIFENLYRIDKRFDIRFIIKKLSSYAKD